MTQIYQGDVAIIKMQHNKKLIYKKLSKAGLIVAEGEITGHNHRVVAEKTDQVQYAYDETGFYLKIGNTKCQLVHQEHSVITLEPNSQYWLGQQYEYDELEEYKKVQD